MRVLEERLRATLGLDAGVPIRVALSPAWRIATFRIHIAFAAETVARQNDGLLRQHGAQLRASSWVHGVTVIYPHLYLEPTTDALAELVHHDHESSRTTPTTVASDAKPHNVSYCSPNANKPLHLGHARNLCIGDAISRLLARRTPPVLKTCILSDYGVHIARAAVSYHQDGNGQTPADVGVKPDHFVGQHYHRAHERAQAGDTSGNGLEAESRTLLLEFLQGSEPARQMFRTLTDWCSAGIRQTFARFGTTFDRYFHESDMLPICRRLLQQGLDAGVLVRCDDGSVRTMASDTSPEVIVLRSDQSPLYLLNAMATLVGRFEAIAGGLARSLVITGEEQRPHLGAALSLLGMLGYDCATRIEGVHYGLVNTAHGRMRSRQGDVVLLDSILDELEAAFRNQDAWADEAPEVISALSVGTLRTYLLGYPLDKPINFDPDDLINGRGALFARVVRAARRGREACTAAQPRPVADAVRRELLRELCRLDEVLDRAAVQREPSVAVSYLRALCSTADAYLARGASPRGRPEDIHCWMSAAARTMDGLALPPLSLFVDGRPPVATTPASPAGDMAPPAACG